MTDSGQAPSPPTDAAPQQFTARIEPAGETFVAQADRPLLLAAEQAGVNLPSSCRNGTCRTCMCMLSEGQVGYRIQWPGLLPEEKAQGWFLPCIAFPLSDLVLRRRRDTAPQSLPAV
jgi:ferredoxin